MIERFIWQRLVPLLMLILLIGAAAIFLARR